MENLAAIVDRESATLNDPNWDVEERTSWVQKVSPELEERMINTDWEALSFDVLNLPTIPERSIFSALEHKCTDHSGNLMVEKETFLELASEHEAKEPLTCDIEELLRIAPFSPQSKFSSPVYSAADKAS